MAFTWLEKLLLNFGSGPDLEPATPTITEVITPQVVVPPSTDVAKIRATFDEKMDILVISEDYVKTLNDEDRAWVESLLNIVIYFTGNTLINIGVVTAPRYYSGYRA